MRLDFEVNALPEDERIHYHTFSKLKKSEKKFLMDLAAASDGNHVCVYPEVNREIRKLETLELIRLNYQYEGSDYSFVVLENAPQLMRKLKKRARLNSGFLRKVFG